ncbi:MAG: hypothetical protein IBJ17_06345 [Reyranella sp.]|nr:hypothetical protein [Reyranella sp.]
MASIPIPGAPAAPAAEPWPDDDPVSIRADELFARRLDTDFATGVRGLLHDPETGLSSLSGEAALEAVAGIYPALEALKQRTLGDAVGPRQKALLQPLIDTRLDWAAGTIGRLAERATVEVDDLSVAERLAGLRQDAEASWHDPAHLQKLGRAAVGELRWQGERRGWDDAETDARTRGGLSDLYAGAVEAAMAQDLDGAASLLAHASEVIAPDRLKAIDRRLTRAREDGLLREVDVALSALPLDPAAAPSLDVFAARAAELTPEDTTPDVRTRLDELAAHAHRRAERRWQKLQSEAGVAALDWLRQNPGASMLFLPEEVRAWLASDQLDGLRTLEEQGRLVTDPDLFERLDRQLVYEPGAFATLDLDRHRLSLDDADHARFAAAQKAIAEGVTDPAFARYRLARLDVDQRLERMGIDEPDGEEAPPADRAESQGGDDVDPDDPLNVFRPHPDASPENTTHDWFHEAQDIRENRQRGLAAERSVLEEIRKRDSKAGLAKHIRIYVDGGPRYMVGDIVLNRTGTSIVLIEVKSGMAELTPMQVKVLAEAVKSGNIYFTNVEAAEKLRAENFRIEANRTFAAQNIVPQVYIVDGNHEAMRRQLTRAGLEVVSRTVGAHRILAIRARST